VGGQYSADILPIPEKISFGSTRFGRGYQAGEFSGDSGMGASAELNYQFLINQAWIKSAEPYLLYEWARTHQQTSGQRQYAALCQPGAAPVRQPPLRTGPCHEQAAGRSLCQQSR
jgi:hemolysin activation/secretion protein